MAVAEEVLAAQQHLQAGIFNFFSEASQAVPRVLVEEADAGIEGSPAPHLEREKTHFIQFLGDGQHIPSAHSGGDERLVGVPEGCIGDLNAHLETIFPFRSLRLVNGVGVLG